MTSDLLECARSRDLRPLGKHLKTLLACLHMLICSMQGSFLSQLGDFIPNVTATHGVETVKICGNQITSHSCGAISMLVAHGGQQKNCQDNPMSPVLAPYGSVPRWNLAGCIFFNFYLLLFCYVSNKATYCMCRDTSSHVGACNDESYTYHMSLLHAATIKICPVCSYDWLRNKQWKEMLPLHPCPQF